jgi:two-component system NtrC family sensor kinase
MRKTSGVTAGGRHSVRYRLLAIALLPTFVILPLLLGITIYRWNAKFDAALISKVNNDLTIAHQYLARMLESTEEQLVSVTESARFHELLSKGDYANGNFAALLKQTAQRRGFDFLYVVGVDGHIIASGYPMASASIRWNWPIIGSALEGHSKTSIDVFERAELSAITPELAQRARIEIVPTVGSTATSPTEETRGLVLQSASALTLPDGQRAALVGGILLNQNLAFVDTINDLIYHGSGLPEGSQGTATLFLGDVRISTNVRLFEGPGPLERAFPRRSVLLCSIRDEPGSIAPSSSMTGTSRRMNRFSTATIAASACSMRDFSRNPSPKRSVRRCWR